MSPYVSRAPDSSAHQLSTAQLRSHLLVKMVAGGLGGGGGDCKGGIIAGGVGGDGGGDGNGDCGGGGGGRSGGGNKGETFIILACKRSFLFPPSLEHS